VVSYGYGKGHSLRPFRGSRSTARWPRDDLARRVVDSLEMAKRAVRTLVCLSTASSAPSEGLLSAKIVAETAMLLLCVAPVRQVDDRIPGLLEEIASLLIPHARSHHVLASICMEPGSALEHAVGHVLLSRLGYPDATVDRLLAQALAMGADFGPERVHHRRLERNWLARMWPVGQAPSSHNPSRKASRLLAESMLGRPLDVLGSSRLDFYAFTHAVMYVSDLGTRHVALPRRSSDIAGDAVAALAFSLDGDDFDLTAELLSIWPMLRLAWSPCASFGFRVLADMQDELGFLPGSGFDRSRHDSLLGAQRMRYTLATSYHTIYVMGFLSAAALLPDRAPASSVPPSRHLSGGGAALLSLFDDKGLERRWRGQVKALSERQQHAVGPLLLAMLLRRAKAKGDLSLIRESLAIALRHDLVDGSAATQAVALLRRSEVLAELAARRDNR
jgi:uncharacterized protein DUF6895